MNFKQKLNIILAEDAASFASSFNVPRISTWIIKQYDKGHRSHKDYEDIVNWVTNNNPNIDEYDFNSALKQAKVFCQNSRQDGFDPYFDLQSNDVVQEFDNGKKWLLIGPEDCNAICHRLRYDCSRELSPVQSGNATCYALQDPQDNTIGILINNSENSQIIGQFGKSISGNNQEIRSLCIKRGINLVPEAYNDMELAKALATKEIDIEKVQDIPAIMCRLSALDIINCNLMKFSHYAPIRTIYDLYNRTGHSCLIQYCLCYLITNGKTSSPAYNTIKIAALRDDHISNTIKNNKSSDTRFYSDLMDDSISAISSIED